MDENAKKYAVFVQSVLKFFALCNRVAIGGNEQPANVLKPYRLIYTVFSLENSAYCDLPEFIILYFVFSIDYSFLDISLKHELASIPPKWSILRV